MISVFTTNSFVMESIAKLYTRKISKNFFSYHGNWTPSDPIELGDFGYLKKGVFLKQGNIFDNNEIQLKKNTKKMNNHNSFVFYDKTCTVTKTNISGNQSIKVNFSIDFKKKHAIFLKGFNVSHLEIKNKDEIGKFIINQFYNDKWHFDYYIVTRLKKYDKAIVAVSDSQNSCINIELSTSCLESLEINSPSGSFSLSNVSNINHVYDLKKATIMIELSKLEDIDNKGLELKTSCYKSGKDRFVEMFRRSPSKRLH